MSSTTTTERRTTRTPHPFDSFPPRVRFNWGFHDASRDCVDRAGRTGADELPALPAGSEWAPYRAGYLYGWHETARTGSRPETSDAGWQDYQLGVPATLDARKALRLVRDALEMLRGLADSYSDEMLKIGRGHMELGTDAGSESVTGRAGYALRVADAILSRPAPTPTPPPARTGWTDVYA